MNQRLRISQVASMGWCEIKAQRIMRGLEVPKTEEVDKGDKWHNLLGFNQNYPVLINYGGYEIEGHIDRLAEHEGEKVVLELKTTSGAYYVNYLLAPAHIQANLYAYAVGAKQYGIIVFFTKDQRFWGLMEKMSETRAERDLKRAIGIYEGRITPIPTTRGWKCVNCPVTDCEYWIGKVDIIGEVNKK